VPVTASRPARGRPGAGADAPSASRGGALAPAGRALAPAARWHICASRGAGISAPAGARARAPDGAPSAGARKCDALALPAGYRAAILID